MQTRLAVEMALRLTFSRQQQRFTRWVAIFATLGLALGVASLITVMSVMNGLAGELRGRLLSVIPHAEITLVDEALVSTNLDPEPFIALEHITDAHHFLRSPVMVRGLFANRGAVLSGIPVTEQGYRGPRVAVVSGSLEGLAGDFSIALGEPLAASLGVSVGDSVDLFMPSASLTPFGVLPRYRKLTVTAIVTVGTSVEATLALVSTETAQRLLARSTSDGIRLYADNPEAIAVWQSEVQAVIPEGYVLSTWADSNQALFRAIRMEKVTVGLLLAAVILVAAFNIVSTLTMSVTEKRSDIAAMRVMGLSRTMVQRVFLYHGLILALCGTALGALIGLVLSHHLGTVMRWIEGVFGWGLFDPSIYYIAGLPVDIQGTDIALSVIGALVLSLLAALYPAYRASLIQPAEALGGMS
jgi:lipoprotein-releasing system permease protein